MKQLIPILGPSDLPLPAREIGFYSTPLIFIPQAESESEFCYYIQLSDFVHAARHHAVRIVWRVHPYQFPATISQAVIERAVPLGKFYAGLLELAIWLHPFAKGRGMPYEGPLEWWDEILFLSANLSIKPHRNLKGRMIGGKERFEELHQRIRAKLRGVQVVTSDSLTEADPQPVNLYRDTRFLQENFKGDLHLIQQYVQPQADLFDLAIEHKKVSGRVDEAWQFFLSAYSDFTRFLTHSPEIGKVVRRGNEYYRSTGRGRSLEKL